LRFGREESSVRTSHHAGRLRAALGIVFSLLALSLLLDAPVCLAGKQVRVGLYDLHPLCEMPPSGLSAAGRTQEASGLFPALLRAIAEKAEWDLAYVSCSRRECLGSLNAGSLDLLAAAPYAKELGRTFAYTRETVIPTWAQVYARGELSVQSWFDFNTRGVGVVRDDPYNAEVRAIIERFGINCTFVEFKNYQEILSALQDSWVDIGVVDRFSGMALEIGENIVRTPIIFAPIELRFAVAKDRNEELVATLDYHLRTMKRDPKSLYYTLIHQLFVEPQEFRLPPLVFWGLSLAGGFLILLLGTNFLLQRRVSVKTAELAQNNDELKNELLMRRAAESATRESNRKFQVLFEFSPDAIFLLTVEGQILDCNIAAETLTQYNKEEVLQMSIVDLMLDEADKTSPHLPNELLSADACSCDVLLERKHGGSFPAEVRTKFLQLGGTKALLCIIKDLTQQKKVEEEILRVRKLESINLLAGGIAHDFNNILSAILGNVSLARMFAEPGDRISARLETAEKAVVRARDLTCQLLTFAKGGLPIKETTSLASVIRDSCDFALRGSNVLCHLSVPEDLWPVEADVGQISQVLNNLMINAKEAMPNGGIVELVAENKQIESADSVPLRSGRHVMIVIRDHGTGIPQEHLSKIFDPYFTTKTSGNGLGLATSHSIIRKHGGHIVVESQKDAGTIFKIYLPASKRELPKEVDANSEPIVGKGKILVMDDEEMVRDMAGDMLSHLHYEVHLAKNGPEAIEAIRQATQSGKPFEAVIMDLTIPGGCGGKEVIKEVRKIDPQVKAIVSSGYSNDPIMADFTEHGFDGVVTKPYGIEKLSEVIHRVISKQAHDIRGGTAV